MWNGTQIIAPICHSILPSRIQPRQSLISDGRLCSQIVKHSFIAIILVVHRFRWWLCLLHSRLMMLVTMKAVLQIKSWCAEPGAMEERNISFCCVYSRRWGRSCKTFKYNIRCSQTVCCLAIRLLGRHQWQTCWAVRKSVSRIAAAGNCDSTSTLQLSVETSRISTVLDDM